MDEHWKNFIHDDTENDVGNDTNDDARHDAGDDIPWHIRKFKTFHVTLRKIKIMKKQLERRPYIYIYLHSYFDQCV